MKKDVAVIIVLSVIALGLVAACVLIFGFGIGASSKKVTDFDEIFLTTSPGRGKTTRYIIVCDDDETEISIKVTTSAKGDNGSTISGVCDTEDMIELLNDCEVLSWDGFDEVDKKSSGIEFDFEAVINGKEIEAEGRGKYPKNFEDFVEGVEELLVGSEDDEDYDDEDYDDEENEDVDTEDEEIDD